MGASHRYGLHCGHCGDYFRRSATAFFYRQNKGERQGCRACSERLAHECGRKDWTLLVTTAASKGVTILTTAGELYARPDARCTLRCEHCTAAGQGEAESTWEVGRRALLGGRYGCSRCAGKARLTAEVIRARVEDRGWQVVSLPEGPMDNRAKVRVRCERGHIFPKAVRALQASGCPDCPTKRGRSGKPNRRLTPEQAAIIAAQAGWILMEPGTFRNTKTKMRYRCAGCTYEIETSHAQMLHKRCPHGCPPPSPPSPCPDSDDNRPTPVPAD